MERNAQGLGPRPHIGLGIYILNDKGEVLLGKRKGSHGSGQYAPPGGHLEFGETFEEAARKEIEEETGLRIENIELFYVDNNLEYIETDRKHYVTLSFKTKHLGGEPQLREPEKCESWEWYSPSKPPSPLAEFAKRALAHLSGKISI